MDWVLASGNAGKVGEFHEILDSHFQAKGDRLLSLRDIGFTDEIPETGTTFFENARIKAEAIARFFSGPIISDDSGLEVEALDWAPGVYTARFAGVGATNATNRAKLLAELQKAGALSLEQRRARFVCVLALLWPGKAPRFFSAMCAGTIALEESGSGGFGYDPLFIPEGYSETFAALPGDIKHQLSHRGKAIQSLLLGLQES